MVGDTDDETVTLTVLEGTVAGEAHDADEVNVHTIAEVPLIGTVSVLLLEPTGLPFSVHANEGLLPPLVI